MMEISENIMFGIIYKATSPSGKVYIGQTAQSLEERIRLHKYHALNKNSPAYHRKFSQAIRKYEDKIVWTILYQNIPYEQLNELERIEINNHNSYHHGYNMTLGGDGGGFLNHTHTDESKQNISDSLVGKNLGPRNGMYGKSGTNNPFYGKKHSEKTKSKMRTSHRDVSGVNNPMFGKTSAMSGKKHSPETIQKMKDKARKRKRKSGGQFDVD